MAELFEDGRIYTFYFASGQGEQQFTGKVVSYEPPLVKVETEGLLRIVNCTSAQFIEAVARREEEPAAAGTGD